MWAQIGKRIGMLRRERKLSRRQLGAMIGCTGQYIGKVERGVQRLSVDSIARICVTMGVTSDYIIFGFDTASAASALNGLSHEQIGIGLDMLKRLAELINTPNGNEALIQEVMHQQLEHDTGQPIK